MLLEQFYETNDRHSRKQYKQHNIIINTENRSEFYCVSNIIIYIIVALKSEWIIIIITWYDCAYSVASHYVHNVVYMLR